MGHVCQRKCSVMVTMMLLLYVIHPIQINGYQPRQDFKQISAPQLKRANKNHTAIVPIPSDFCMNHHHHPISRRVVWDKVCASSTSSLSLLLGCSLFPASALGLSPKEAADSYDTYAANYDYLDAGKASNMLGIDDARTELFRQAKGNVLEIGAGTGLNLLKYDYDKISTLTLLDISDGMLNEARQRREQIISEVTYDKTRKSPQHDDNDDDNKNIKKKLTTIEFVTADATSQLVTKFNENTFDTVVDSFSLCVMGNDGARACLKEISKVVKPIQDGGQILLLENSRSSNGLLGMYQDATADIAASSGGKGCVYNQDVRALIESVNGLKIEKEDQYSAGLFRAFRCVKVL